MKVAGVREFRNQVPQLLQEQEPVFVTKHGKLTSLLLPLEHPERIPVELRGQILDQLGAAISGHFAKLGVTEEQIHSDFKAWRTELKKSRRRR